MNGKDSEFSSKVFKLMKDNPTEVQVPDYIRKGAIEGILVFLENISKGLERELDLLGK